MTTLSPAQIIQILHQYGVPGFATADATLSLEGTSLDEINYAAQLAATTASLGANKNLAWAAANLSASGTAAATGLAVLVRDYQTFHTDSQSNASALTIVHDEGALIADGVTVLGDVLNYTGAIISQVAPNLKIGSAISGASDILTIAGVAANHLDSIDDFISLASADIRNGDYRAFFSPDQNQAFDNASASVETAWSSAETELSNAVGFVSNLFNSSSAATFDTNVSALGGVFGEMQSSLTDLSNTTNILPESLNETVDGNSSTVVGDTTNDPNFEGNIVIGSDGGATATDMNADGQTTAIAQYNADGSSMITDYGDDGAIADQDIENIDGPSAITTYASNGSSTTTHYTGPNGTGAPDQSAAMLVFNTVDYVTGAPVAYSAGVTFDASSFVLPAVRLGTSSNTTFGTTAHFVAGNLNPYQNDPNKVHLFLTPAENADNLFVSPMQTSEAIVFNSDDFQFQSSGAYSNVALLQSGGAQYEVVSAPVNFTYSEDVYAPAVAQVSYSTGAGPQTYYFHVGDAASIGMVVTNSVVGDLADSLAVAVGSAAGIVSSASSAGYIAEGQSATLSVGLNTSASGSYTVSPGNFSFLSHDSELADIAAAAAGYSSTVNINQYADPILANVSTAQRTGNLVSGGPNQWTLDFGYVIYNNNNPTATSAVIDILDGLSSGQMDSLKGTLSESGGGFSDAYALTLANYITAGGSITMGQFTPLVNVLGAQTETIAFHPVGFNASGYSGALADRTLTIADDVVSSSDVPIAMFLADQAALDQIGGGFSIVDTAANIANALGALAGDANVVSITATGGALSETVAAFAAGKNALDKLSGGFAIFDTAAKIGAALNTLEADASNIRSISFSDANTPVLSLTQTQAAADATLLAKIVAPYDLDVTGVVGEPYASYAFAYGAGGQELSATYFVNSPASGGAIALSSVVSDVKLASGQSLGATVSGFKTGDTIDFEGVAFTAGDYATFVGNGLETGGTVTVDNAAGAAIASFKVAGVYKPSQFALSNDGTGHLLVSGVVGLASQTVSDFNADDESDILWRNGNGDALLWSSNGSGGFASKDFGVVDNSYQVAGTGDFNGDGHADIAWRNAGGDTLLWKSNGSGGFTGQDLGVVDTSYKIAGIGDFNGDGDADFLWRNTGGDTLLWKSNGSGGFAGQDLGVVDTSYQVAGIGDFNGDGDADFLWRSTGGDTLLWKSNGSGGFAGQDLGIVDTSYQVAAVGDFNGDGKADFLWRSTGGDTLLWKSNGSGGFTGQDLGIVDTSYQVAGIGDFNGDGKADVIWRSAGGDTLLWDSNGAGGFTGHDLGAVATSWKVQAA